MSIMVLFVLSLGLEEDNTDSEKSDDYGSNWIEFPIRMCILHSDESKMK